MYIPRRITFCEPEVACGILSPLRSESSDLNQKARETMHMVAGPGVIAIASGVPRGAHVIASVTVD